MKTISNEQKAIEIAENAKLPLSLNEADDVLRAINICSKKDYFKAAVKYGALVMAQWKDKQHEKEKQTLIQEYENKQREKVRELNSKYGFEGLF